MTNLISAIHAWMAARKTDDRGATMVEYGLMVALIAVVVAVGAGTLGGAIDTMFDTIAGSLP